MSKVKNDESIHNLKRPAIERMVRIHNELKAKTYPNCSKLAREMEVSSKTISRDIDFMRDRMVLPIEYDSKRHGYYYAKEVQSLPSVNISEGELLALTIAQKAMDHYRGTPFEKPLSNALNKLSASLPDTLTANLNVLSQSISFKQGRQSQVSETMLADFTKSVLEKRDISFRYKKLGAEQAEERTLSTYHLTNFQGRWYAIGRDAKRQAIRTFLLNRASNPKLLHSEFRVPETFSPEDYLGSSFGIYAPEGEHQVAIEFRPPIAEYVAENLWHPSQQVEYKDRGSIEIRFSLGSLIEISSWILSWGANAKVLGPPELQALVLENAKAIVSRYDRPEA